MQHEQQPKAPEASVEQRGVAADSTAFQTAHKRSRIKNILTLGAIMGAFLLGLLMVKLFPEFAVSKVIYAMVGR